MKVKNRHGIVLNVPDDWTDEILGEKSLVVVPKSSQSEKSAKVAAGKSGKPRPAASGYESMPLQRLKALARKRNLRVGRSGKKRIAQMLEESDT